MAIIRFSAVMAPTATENWPAFSALRAMRSSRPTCWKNRSLVDLLRCNKHPTNPYEACHNITPSGAPPCLGGKGNNSLRPIPASLPHRPFMRFFLAGSNALQVTAASSDERRFDFSQGGRIRSTSLMVCRINSIAIRNFSLMSLICRARRP